MISRSTISASMFPSLPLQLVTKVRRLLGGLCVLALPLTLQAQQASVLSYAGQQTSLTLTPPLTAPVAIAIDALGNRFLLNHGSSNVTEISATGVQTTITVALTNPSALAVDSADNLYIADTSSTHIIKVDTANNNTVSSIGSSLLHPSGVAVDSANNVYFTDSGNKLVKKYTAYNGAISTVAGTYTDPVGLAIAGSNLYISDIGSTTLYQLPIIGTNPQAVPFISNLTNQPYDVSADTFGNVFLSGGTDHVLTMYGANGSIRQLGSGLGQPEGTALDETGSVYVADQTTPAIDIIAPGSVNLGQANLCPSSSAMPAPCTRSITLHFNVASNVSLSNVTTRVVAQGVAGQDFTPSSDTCTGTLTGPTTCSVTVQFAPLAPGLRLGAVDIDAQVGSASTSALLATVPLSGLGLSSLAGFDAGIINTVPVNVPDALAPSSVIADSIGDIYFIDHASCVVDKFSSSTQATTTIAGSGVCGPAAGSGGPATMAVFRDPYRLALNGRGDLFISDDLSNVIWKVDARTQVITQIAGVAGTASPSVNVVAQGNPIGTPYALALDGAGDLYFSDYTFNIVQKIDATTGILTTVAGVANAGAGYTGDGGPATNAQLHNPIGLAVDGAGNLYIDDVGNEIIRVVSASTGVISTVAGTQGNTPGYSGDGGLATSAQLADPEGIAVDAAGNLYIADTNNYVVRKVNALTGFISTIVGTATGSEQYAGDAGAANLAGLSDLADVALDGAGDIYVADNTNNAIRVVTPASGVANFATYTMGTASPEIDVVVTNNGNLPLALSGLAASTNFNLGGTGTTCTAATTLAVGGQCTLGIEFLPTAVGLLTGSVTLTDNVGNDPTTTQTLALTGTGAYVPTQVVLTGVPATISTGGTLGTVQATIESSGNNVVTNSTAAVTATVTGPGNYSAAVNANAVSGVASLDLSSLVLSNPGTYTVTASSAGLTSGVETTTVVAPPHLVLSALPASISSGSNLGVATVSIEDSTGAVISSSASVALSINGPANYSHTSAVAAVNGVATFDLTSLALTGTGTYTVTATSPGDTAATTIVTVVAPPATQLVLSGIPASIVAGGNLGTATVSIESAGGGVVTTTSASVTLTVTGPGSYSQALTASARSGVATFSLSTLPLTTTGTYTVTATSPGLSSATATVMVTAPVTITLTSAQSSATVAAGGAATYTISLPATTSTAAQPVTFTATGLPAGATASFAPATLTPGPAAVSTTLTIQTAASTAALDGLPGALRGLGSVAMGLLLLPFAASRRLRKGAARLPMLSLLFGLLSAGVILGLSGCGGGGSSSTTPTPQTYTITVTGTSASGSGSTTVTLIVQ